MMSQLPFDLHVLFIEWVYRHSQADMTDYATLAACALVCRAWTPVAQRLLYRRLPGKFFVGKERLIDTIRRNPALGTHVRRSPIDDLVSRQCRSTIIWHVVTACVPEREFSIPPRSLPQSQSSDGAASIQWLRDTGEHKGTGLCVESPYHLPRASPHHIRPRDPHPVRGMADHTLSQRVRPPHAPE
ncbi:hypothetical protein FA95DRAFT_1035792 [Auriscalpium vulgare]|uniref:Uncharacterized protein n=1 Tax=Auriscalpium vulgare TaxID=40419 RepID=A0ACB8R5L1_9AGAM|nr:hypothetical protein FA95DRAFT_1035792 [Auriscalpium vulgare]